MYVCKDREINNRTRYDSFQLYFVNCEKALINKGIYIYKRMDRDKLMKG